MRQIRSLFVREGKPFRAIPELSEGMEWVVAGEGTPSVKFDGTACCVHCGLFYKRLKVKSGGPKPPSWIHWRTQAGLSDPAESGHGWAMIGLGNEDAHHREGLKHLLTIRPSLPEGTYELVGPSIQRNPYNLKGHELWKHGADPIVALPMIEDDIPLLFTSLRSYLEHRPMEGIVWRNGEYFCKLKRTDFGFQWPIR